MRHKVHPLFFCAQKEKPAEQNVQPVSIYFLHLEYDIPDKLTVSYQILQLKHRVKMQ